MIVIEPSAQADIDTAVAWYDENEYEMGSAFLRQLRATLASVLEKPARYPRARPGLHRAKMQRFPYTIFYSFGEGTVYVIAVLHHRRDASVLDARLN